MREEPVRLDMSEWPVKKGRLVWFLVDMQTIDSCQIMRGRVVEYFHDLGVMQCRVIDADNQIHCVCAFEVEANTPGKIRLLRQLSDRFLEIARLHVSRAERANQEAKRSVEEASRLAARVSQARDRLRKRARRVRNKEKRPC